MDKLKEDIFYLKKDFLVQKTNQEDFDHALNIICAYNHNNMEYIFKEKTFYDIKTKDLLNVIPDAALMWGERMTEKNIELVNYAYDMKLPLFIAENSFVRSAYSWPDCKVSGKFSDGISFIIDKYQYFDATNISSIEQTLQDPEFKITDEQKFRTQKCIKKIISNKLTKYNHQPIYEPKIGRSGVEKVLVIDQTYRDMAIVKGLANDFTFESMLRSAINENPDADIIVKTHPDVVKGAITGYYQNLKSKDNVYVLTDPINPISLIEYCDKVYVCSSQFGFEALMCGKEVHTFGMPFYAGWGLTNDRIKLKRRSTKRSLEEVFYVAYIMYSYWVNPQKQSRCEIEEALDSIIELRRELFEYLEKLKEEEVLKQQKLYNYLQQINKPTMLWGASLFLEEVFKKYKIENENILGIIDRNQDLQGSKLGGYEIYAPDVLEILYPEQVIVTIINSADQRKSEIEDYINKEGLYINVFTVL